MSPFWLILFIPICGKITECHEIVVAPSDPEGVKEGDVVVFEVRVNLNATGLTSSLLGGNRSEIFLVVESDKGLVDFENGSIFFLSEDELYGERNLSVALKVLSFGQEVVTFSLCLLDENGSLTCDDPLAYRTVRLNLLREKDAFDLIFIVAVSIVMIVGNVNMGCFLDLQVLRTMFKKPMPIIIGFGCQYLYMPLGSYAIGWIFSHDLLIRLGFFVLGCCPGSVGSNSWTLLFRGDVNLSVIMTFVSTVTSFAMIPLWIFTLGREFFILGDLRIPYVNLVTSLLIFVLPVGVGILIKRLRPNWAEYSKKVIRPYTVIVMIFFLTIGIYANLYLIRLMTWKIVASGAIIAWGGYVIGALVAHISCLNKQQCIAMAIETALQNPAMAFVLLKVSLPPPSDDIGIVSPVAQLLVAHVPLWMVYIPYIIQRRMKKKKDAQSGKNLQETKTKSRSLIELKSLLRKQSKSCHDVTIHDKGSIVDEEVGPQSNFMSSDTKPTQL